MKLTIHLPFEALYIMYRLQQAGYEAYLVGGAVRDILINALNNLKTQEHNRQIVTDFDFTTNARPEEIQQIFKQSYYTNEYGMVGIGYNRLVEELEQNRYELPKTNLQEKLTSLHPKQKKLIDIAQATKVHKSLKDKANQLEPDPQITLVPPPFEVTTYRSEGVYEDFRRPAELEWGESIYHDLERRDFTINALAISVKSSFLQKVFKQNKRINQSQIQLTSDDYQLIDEHHGLKDLAANLIKTVGSPDERFQEDALRMLRAVRLAAQLQMKIDPVTKEAIQTHADLIQKISMERVRDEFLKMLSTNQPDRAIKLLDQTNLLPYFLPELESMKGVDQGGHHTTDVWTHALSATKHCPCKDPIVRLATLLHDIGKPGTYQIRDGNITFYNHEIVSSRITSRIGKRLKLSKDEQQKLFDLVRYHMFYYQPHHTDAAIRRLMKRVGLKNIDDILDLREGDRLGSGAKKTSWRLEELKQRMVDQLHQPFDTTDLAINGHDLMNELNLKPGPTVGTVLNELTERVLDNPDLNQKEKLMAEAKKILSSEAS